MSGGTDVERDPATHAEWLKERVYLTFTALAVVLALRSHHATASEAAVTLLIAVLGTLLAVFVADVMSHIVAHASLPSRPELRAMVRMSFGTLGVLIFPFVFIGFAISGRWRVEAALQAATIALVSSLVAIGYIAVRRVRLPVWQKLLVLFAEFVLGAAVVGLELLAHGV